MQPIDIDEIALSVRVSLSFVCLSVAHVHEPCKNDWTDRDAIWGLTQVGPRNHVLHGSGNGQF